MRTNFVYLLTPEQDFVALLGLSLVLLQIRG